MFTHFDSPVHSQKVVYRAIFMFDTQGYYKETVCGQEETHSMNQEQLAGACQNVQLDTTITYQNKEVHIILEFPEESDARAESEFISRLKEIYLRKIEPGDKTHE